MKFNLSATGTNLIILLILLLATLLRLINLEGDPFWIDERGHIEVALSDDISDLFAGVREHAAAAPLDYLLLRLYQGMTGAGTRFELRLLYVFYGVVSVYLIYLLARSIYNPTVGFLSAYVLSISFYHFYYSQEVRFYALSALIGILSTLLFLYAWKRGSWANWLFWGLVCILGLYTHYFLAFVFFGQLAWLGVNELRRWQKKGSLSQLFRSGVAFGISLIAFLPWLVWAGNTPLSNSLGLGISFGEVTISFISALGPSVAFLVFSPFGVFSKKESWLLLVLIIFPFLCVYLADNFAGYFFNARQVIFALPFSIILCAASLVYFASGVLTAAEKQNKPGLKFVLAAAGVLLLLVFTWANGVQILDYFTQSFPN